MGKNQHVTPHKDGGWQVKGENNLRATVRRRKLLKELGKLPVSKNRSFLFMERMEEYAKEIHMVMIHIRRKGNGY